jgi:hypothetical protein
VLYWTSTNSIQLVTQEWGRLRRHLRPTEMRPPG